MFWFEQERFSFHFISGAREAVSEHAWNSAYSTGLFLVHIFKGKRSRVAWSDEMDGTHLYRFMIVFLMTIMTEI